MRRGQKRDRYWSSHPEEDPKTLFWMKVDKDGPIPEYAPHLGPCWLWMASLSSGYGQVRIAQRRHYAHRLAYEWLIGAIPFGLTLDHLCLIQRCVNPSHLEPVTRSENSRRQMERLLLQRSI